MVACGPFTTQNKLNYDALRDLLQVVRRDRPNALILMGPFLDLRNSQIQDGELYFEKTPGKGDYEFVDYDELFANIMSMVNKEVEGTNTTLMMVPHPKDIHHINPLP